ncbi:MAG: hypothetical protein R3A80_10065 [Bdellovibrionota bacterium]
MGNCYKTFRVSKKEELLIKKFLKANPLLDFSTLARAAVLSFIKEPDLKLKGIAAKKDLVSRRDIKKTLNEVGATS